MSETAQKPEADQDTVARLRQLSGWTKEPQLPTGAQGPDCIWCNGPTRRTGACFTCISCGHTTSC